MPLRFHDRATRAAFAARLALTLVGCGWLWAAPVTAAVPVEESIAGERLPASRPVLQMQAQTGTPAPISSSTPAMSSEQAQVAADAGSDARRLSELFYQLQVLQQELQELRGTVEEQSHQLSRIARDQQEQYIDLDRRVAALRNNSAAPTISTPTQVATATTAVAGGGASSSEREVYTQAFNLMKSRQFDESADAFNRLIVNFPNGQFTPNAFYWLGELYLAKSEYEKARQSFAQVTNLYPDHQKVADALYKLGVVYHRLDDTRRSLEYLTRVQREHPQSSAAGLAETYAAELQ